MTGREYYANRMKKTGTNRYKKKTQDTQWKTCVKEGEPLNDITSGCRFLHTYNYGIELGLFWVDYHLTKNTCKVYVKSSLPENTPVRVTAYKTPNHTTYSATAMGVLNNGMVVLDFYDDNNQLFYPESNTNSFVFDFEVGDEIIEIEKRPTVYYNSGEKRRGKGNRTTQKPVWKKVEEEKIDSVSLKQDVAETAKPVVKEEVVFAQNAQEREEDVLVQNKQEREENVLVQNKQEREEDGLVQNKQKCEEAIVVQNAQEPEKIVLVQEEHTDFASNVITEKSEETTRKPETQKIEKVIEEALVKELEEATSELTDHEVAEKLFEISVPEEGVTTDTPNVGGIQNTEVPENVLEEVAITLEPENLAIEEEGMHAESAIVEDAEIVSENQTHIVYAFTNRDKTLADITGQLLPGYKFVNPKTLISKFAGESEKEFAVMSTQINGSINYEVQKVKFITLKGILPVLDIANVELGEGNRATLTVKYLWKDTIVKEELENQLLQNYEIQVTASKKNIINIQKEENAFLISGCKTGKVHLNVVLKEKGKKANLFAEKVNFAVTGKNADIHLEVVGACYNEEGNYYSVERMQPAQVLLKADAGKHKLTWSTSDAGIVKIKSSSKGNSSVVIKDSGEVILTATANDAAKTTKSIRLCVLDATPGIDTQVTINKAQEKGGTFGIYPSFDYDIKPYDVKLMRKDNPEEQDGRFMLQYNMEKDIYEVSMTEPDSIKPGKYKAVIKVIAMTGEGEQEYFRNLLISVINEPVEFTVKQKKNVNLFYTDKEGKGNLYIHSKEAKLESAKLENCDFSYDVLTQDVVFTGTETKKIVTSGMLVLKFEGYKEIRKKVNIRTERKKPEIVTTPVSSILYPEFEIKEAEVQLKEKHTNIGLWVEDRNLRQENAPKDVYVAKTRDGKIYLQLKENIPTHPKTAKIKMSLKMDNWSEEISFLHTVKCDASERPQLTLSKEKLVLNKNYAVACYQKADVGVALKDAPENTLIKEVVVRGADRKTLNVLHRGFQFEFDETTNKLTAGFNNSNAVDKRIYNYTVRTEVAPEKSIAAKLKIAVVDKPVTVDVNTKGTIDVLDRKNSRIICTPKMDYILGEITDIRLVGADAHLFYGKLEEEGKVSIQARKEAAYITNYPYSIMISYTLNNGENTYVVESNPITIKVKQGRVNINSELLSNKLYQTADNPLNLDLEACNSRGEKLIVKEISIIETKAIKEAFEICYNESAECYQLYLKNYTKVKKGSNYTLKLKVKFEGHADNEKPEIVSVKVTVK